jgi:hypothetical protein
LKYLIFFLLISLFISLSAQDNSDIYDEDYFEENQKEIDVDTSFFLKRSPSKAALLSAFIPGGGQIYNEKYIKASGIIFIELSLFSTAMYYNKKMIDYKNKMKKSVIDSPDYSNNKFYYHDSWENRQSYIYWTGACIFLSTIEAFVDAHLENFNLKKNEIHLNFDEDKLVISFTF